MSPSDANARLATLLADRAAGKNISNSEISYATSMVKSFEGEAEREREASLNRANKESEARIKRDNRESEARITRKLDDDRRQRIKDEQRNIEAENRRARLLEQQILEEEELAAEEDALEAQRQAKAEEDEAILKRNAWQILAIIKEHHGAAEKISAVVTAFLDRKCTREGDDWLAMSNAYLTEISSFNEQNPDLLLPINTAINAFEDFVFSRRVAIDNAEKTKFAKAKKAQEDEKIQAEIEILNSVRKNEIKQEKIARQLKSYRKLSKNEIKCGTCGHTGRMGFSGRVKPPILVIVVILPLALIIASLMAALGLWLGDNFNKHVGLFVFVVPIVGFAGLCLFYFKNIFECPSCGCSIIQAEP